MEALVVYRVFMILYGRAGRVSVNSLKNELGMSRSTANRYMKKMINAGLVHHPARGRYMPTFDVEFLNGFARFINPMEYYSYHQTGTIANIDGIPF